MSDNKNNVESTNVSPNSKQTDNIILDEFVGMDIPKGVTINPDSDSKDIKLSVVVTDKPLSNNTNDNVNDNNLTGKEIGHKNLIPLNCRTKEEQREIQKKGGKARAEQMKQRMTMKENLNLLLQCKLSNRQSVEIADEFANLVGEDTSVQNVLMIQTLKQAMSGDTKAIALVRDTIGEKPAEESIITADIMTDADRKVLANVIKRTSKDSTE